MGNIQALNKLEVLLENIITKSCKGNIDDIVNTNDVLHNIGHRTINKSLNKHLRKNEDLID